MSVLPLKKQTHLVLPTKYRIGHFVSATALHSAVAFMIAFAPAGAEAACPQWDASGTWTIVQGTMAIPVSLRQNGKVVTGTAQHNARYGDGHFRSEKLVEGSIDGTVDGDNFNVQIYWPDGLVGVYTAKIGPQGRIEGRTYDKNKPSSNASWYSNRVMRCGEASPVPSSVILKSTLPPAPVSTPRPGKPVTKTGGKPRPATPPETTGVPAQPPAAGPRITARPSLVVIPAGETQGSTTVTWDGGADHPYAELWVKEGDADERFVAEQGKGSRSVSVKPGTSYLFILTDNGKRLGTATVKVRP